MLEECNLIVSYTTSHHKLPQATTQIDLIFTLITIVIIDFAPMDMNITI